MTRKGGKGRGGKGVRRKGSAEREKRWREEEQVFTFLLGSSSLETDRQHLIHMNRQVTLNITCGAGKKLHATAHIHIVHLHIHTHTHTHTHTCLHLCLRKAPQTEINSLLECTQTSTPALSFSYTHSNKHN